MTKRYGISERKYPVMKGKSRARTVCGICPAATVKIEECMIWRRTGACPVDLGFDIAETIAQKRTIAGRPGVVSK